MSDRPIEAKELRFYKRRDGQRPFESWLESLRDRQAVIRILARLNRARVGNLGDYRPVGEGVCELWLDFGPGYRIYFGQDGRSLIILLCGGDKSSQEADIRRAKEYWSDYKERARGTER